MSTKNFRAPALEKESYLISFEGIEGSGKSTQIKSLQTELENEGFTVKLVREPGGTEFGEKLREAMLQSRVKIDPLAQAYLFASCRAQLLTEVTLPFLSKKKHVVIYDRYIDSSIAYQGVAGGLGTDLVLTIHQAAPLHNFPHLTFYLDIPLALSFERQAKRNQTKDYFESKDRAFYQNLIDGYEEAIKLFPERIKRIDASKSEQEVTGLVLAAFHHFLKGR